MEIFVYRAGAPNVKGGFTADDLPKLLADPRNIVWVDMEAPNRDDLKVLSDVFCFHALTIEDTEMTRDHPKV